MKTIDLKKIASLLLASLLVLGLFAGCSSNTSADAAADSDASSQPALANENPDTAEEPQADADMINITHLAGTTQVPVNPAKAVVMDFGMLDTIQKLGIEVELALPANNLPSYLASYEETSLNIGGLKEYDMEKIHGFQPDIIILGARQQADYDSFAEIAPTIVLSADNSRYLDSAIENIHTLGKVFSKDAQVDEELAEFNAKLEELKEITAGDGMKSLILLTNEGNLSVYGPGSRFGIIHDAFGFPPVDDSIEASTHGQEVNYEYISKFNPDFIFVIDRTAAIGGDVKADKTLDNDLVNATTAAQNDHIVLLNPDVWYLSGGGLESLNLMIDEVLAAVQ